MSQRRSIELTDIASLLLSIYYTWYCLPFMRAAFSSTLYKYLFFGCFAAGTVLLVLARLQHNGMAITFQPWHSILVPVVLYMAVMSTLYLLQVGEASRHIRVSFTFWGTAILYCLFSFDATTRSRFGKYLLLLFSITAATSVVGIFMDSSVARAITNASQQAEAVARDYQLMRKNISGIYLFQSMVIFAPVTVMMIRYRRKPIWGAILLICITAAVLKASFTISLMLLIAGCSLALLSDRKGSVTLILILCLLLLLFLPMDKLLGFLADVIPNQYISTRLDEVSLFLGQGNVRGDLNLRLQCYQYSLNTAFQHPLGVGPWYSYVVGEHGIGFHSEVMDDLARYGIFALGFYLLFFYEYARLLREQWTKVGLACVTFPVCTVYALFLLLNIGFRSADESIFMLFILPALPDILLNAGYGRRVSLEEEGDESK